MCSLLFLIAAHCLPNQRAYLYVDERVFVLLISLLLLSRIFPLDFSCCPHFVSFCLVSSVSRFFMAFDSNETVFPCIFFSFRTSYCRFLSVISSLFC